MSKMIIVEGNSNDKDNARALMVKGEKGYSAYDIYVQNGGTLTEEQWLDAFLNADNYYSKSETNTLLNSKVSVTDIIDNLNSNDVSKPLSAKQGKVLNDDINIINTDPYYEEITYTKQRYYDTDCYITIIPLNDNNGNQIDLYVADVGELLKPSKYAQKEETTLTINASLNIARPEFDMVGRIPSIISNGEIIREYDDNSNLPDCYEYIGITADRTIKSFKVNSITAEELLAQGCVNAFDSFYRLIENGSNVDLSTIHPTTGDEVTTDNHPRQCLGVKADKTIIILTTEGRSVLNKGLTSAETQNILQSLNCINAWNLDGGGSTSTSINTIKINQNYDNNGTTERDIPYVLNAKKSNGNKNIADIYREISKNNENILNLLMPIYKNSNILDLDGLDANELIGKTYIGYGNGILNNPYSEGYHFGNGWFINIPHNEERLASLYNKQIFIYRDSNDYFQREMINGVWSNWSKLNSNVCCKITADRNNNNIITTDTYQSIIYTDIAGDSIATDTVKFVDNSNNTKFKINRYGYVKLKAVISINSHGGKDKYLRIKKNGNTLSGQISNSSLYDGDVGYVIIDVVTSVAPTTEFEFEYRGYQNDAINRGYIIVETI